MEILDDLSDRCGTKDREQATKALTEAFASGYLKEDEFVERLDKVLAAVTKKELWRTFDGLADFDPGSKGYPKVKWLAYVFYEQGPSLVFWFWLTVFNLIAGLGLIVLTINTGLIGWILIPVGWLLSVVSMPIWIFLLYQFHFKVEDALLEARRAGGVSDLAKVADLVKVNDNFHFYEARRSTNYYDGW